MESFEEYFYGDHIFESVEVIEGGLRVRLRPELVEELLNESPDGITVSDLVATVDSGSKKKSRDIKPTFKEIKDGDLLVYQTTSGTRKDGDNYYTQFIKLKDLNTYLYDESDATIKDRIKLALLGDVEVYCDCPAFLYYGFSYMLTQLDAKYGDEENRYPKVRNPKNKGSVCKHLYSILKVLPVHDGKIINAISRSVERRREN